jgi:hypothetical protein
VLDGEIAAPDDRGVTHIDALSEALRLRRPDQFAYFAFDLLYLDGHDLRRCAIEDRKALLRDLAQEKGLWLRPVRHVKTCINPAHLFLGTGADNMADCAKKGRQSRKLTDEDVRQIRSVVGANKAQLARCYGVTDVMIGKIQRGEWWRHLPPA